MDVLRCNAGRWQRVGSVPTRHAPHGLTHLLSMCACTLLPPRHATAHSPIGPLDGVALGMVALLVAVWQQLG
jgi:hypothetical protein